MSTSFCRRLFTSSRLWGLREWMYGEKAKVDSINQQSAVTPATVKTVMSQKDTECHLQSLAQSVLGSSTQPVQWTELKITDTGIKTKILLDCEKTFNRQVPNRDLHTMKTFGDLLKFYNTPVNEPPGKLFPNIKKNLTALPPNLSIEFPPKARPKLERKPFQNFNDPSHKTFPNKKQKKHRY